MNFTGEDMEYDVFPCCTIENRKFGTEIIERLENDGCKRCYHERDFIPGELVDDNICQAIYKSKRTLCILSSDFISSPYYMREFEVASHRNLVLQKKRLILAVLEHSILDGEGISISLKRYILCTLILTALRRTFSKSCFTSCQLTDWEDSLLQMAFVRNLSIWHKKVEIMEIHNPVQITKRI